MNLHCYKVEYNYRLSGDEGWNADHQNVITGPCCLQAQADLVAALKNTTINVQPRYDGDTATAAGERQIAEVRISGVSEVCMVHQVSVKALVDAGVINIDDADPDTHSPDLEPEGNSLPQQPGA